MRYRIDYLEKIRFCVIIGEFLEFYGYLLPCGEYWGHRGPPTDECMHACEYPLSLFGLMIVDNLGATVIMISIR